MKFEAHATAAADCHDDIRPANLARGYFSAKLRIVAEHYQTARSRRRPLSGAEQALGDFDETAAAAALRHIGRFRLETPAKLRTLDTPQALRKKPNMGASLGLSPTKTT